MTAIATPATATISPAVLAAAAPVSPARRSPPPAGDPTAIGRFVASYLGMHRHCDHPECRARGRCRDAAARCLADRHAEADQLYRDWLASWSLRKRKAMPTRTPK